jgi:hypothetical protein
VEAIAAGNQPRSLTRRTLLAIDIPVDWADQERVLGFAAGANKSIQQSEVKRGSR